MRKLRFLMHRITSSKSANLQRPADFSRQGARVSAIGGGFTLIEILVTLLLIGIVIPAIMHAITAAAEAGNAARHRNDADDLAKSQMAYLILAVSQGQNPILSADAALDGSQYHWQASVQPWNQDTTTLGIQEIDLTVSWADRGRLQSIVLSSLAYNHEQQGL